MTDNLIICNICNKTLSSLRTLKLHSKIHERDFKCIHCQKELKNKQNLDYHLSICKDKINHENKTKDNKYEEEINTIKNNHEEELNTIKINHNDEITIIKNKYEEEIKNMKNKYEEEIKTYQKQIKELSTSTNKLVKENEKLKEEQKQLVNRLLDSLEQQKNKVTNVYNDNSKVNNNTVNCNNIIVCNKKNIKNMISKIDVVKNRITNEEEYASLLEKNGATKFFRVTDASRGTITWNDENNNKVSDKHGVSLVTKFCDHVTMRDALDKIKEIEVDEQDHEEQINKSKRLSLCNRIGVKDKKTILNIGKRLVKKGIHVTAEVDEEVDEEVNLVKDEKAYYSGRLTRYLLLITNFILENPERLLFSTPANIGWWLGELFRDHIQSSRQTETEEYIELLDDKNKICRLDYLHFIDLLKTALSDSLINEEKFGRIFANGLTNCIENKEGFYTLVVTGEDPIENLFVNLKLFKIDNDLYQDQAKLLFSRFLSTIPKHNQFIPQEINNIPEEVPKRKKKEIIRFTDLPTSPQPYIRDDKTKKEIEDCKKHERNKIIKTTEHLYDFSDCE